MFGAIALLAALLIAVQMIARQLQAGEEDQRCCAPSALARRWPWATGCSAFSAPSSRVAARGRRRDRALPALAHRPGAPGLSLARGRGRLRGARLRAARAHRRLGAAAVALAYRPAPGRARARNETGAGVVRAWRAWRRVPAPRYPRSPASASPSSRAAAARLCPCALVLFGASARRADRRGHAHFRQRAQHLGLPSRPLRLELELCPHLGEHPCLPGPVPAGQGPGRRRLERRVASPTPRSTARPCRSSWRARMPSQPADARPGTPSKRTTRSSSGRRLSPSCTSGSATPYRELRDAAGAPVYVPPTRMLIVGTATLPAVGNAQGSPHLDGHRRDRSRPGSSRPRSRSSCAARIPPERPAMVFVRLRAGVSPAAGLAIVAAHCRGGHQGLRGRPRRRP